jgi:hypothetical protein
VLDEIYPPATNENEVSPCPWGVHAQQRWDGHWLHIFLLALFIALSTLFWTHIESQEASHLILCFEVYVLQRDPESTFSKQFLGSIPTSKTNCDIVGTTWVQLEVSISLQLDHSLFLRL